VTKTLFRVRLYIACVIICAVISLPLALLFGAGLAAMTATGFTLWRAVPVIAIRSFRSTDKHGHMLDRLFSVQN
jgi:hypothetical protein